MNGINAESKPDDGESKPDDGECKFNDGAYKFYMEEGFEGKEHKDLLENILNLFMEFGIKFPSQIPVCSGSSLNAKETLKKIIDFTDKVAHYGTLSKKYLEQLIDPSSEKLYKTRTKYHS